MVTADEKKEKKTYKKTKAKEKTNPNTLSVDSLLTHLKELTLRTNY